jgi:type I restriction enzyme R subunit
MQKLNPGVVDAGRADEILRKINLLRPNIEGNRDALSWLRGEQSVFVPEENRERNVQLIDFAHPDNNIFLVTDEWKHRGAAFTNRADAVFLI